MPAKSAKSGVNRLAQAKAAAKAEKGRKPASKPQPKKGKY